MFLWRSILSALDGRTNIVTRGDDVAVSPTPRDYIEAMTAAVKETLATSISNKYDKGVVGIGVDTTGSNTCASGQRRQCAGAAAQSLNHIQMQCSFCGKTTLRFKKSGAHQPACAQR